MKTIAISNEYYLSPVTDSDKDRIALCCNDEELFRNTLRVPYPYTENDAQNFLNFVTECRIKYGTDMQFAVRDKSGIMLGVVGVVSKYSKGSHVEEIGYWIGRDFRNQGLASKAIRAFTDYLISHLNYIRIEAIVFQHNEASQRALLKAGFQYEGLLRKLHVKGDRALDCKLFSFIK